jgi:D-glycero-D-manno-heptose 1,7-bisphosphate phosphatase
MPRSPAVFLDRDGTLIVEKEYLSDPVEVCLETDVVEGLALLREHGHPLIVLSNQSGIGRGLFLATDAQRVNDRVAGILRSYGVEILAWYLCPHGPEFGCACRKPQAGMAVAAARDWDLELAGSYVVGDKRVDLELADTIGATGILVTTGHGRDAVDWARDAGRPMFDSVLSAAKYILHTVATSPRSPQCRNGLLPARNVSNGKP